MMYIKVLTPKNDISLAGAKVGVKAGAQGYAGVACKDSGMTALKELDEGELPQPSAASDHGDVNDDGFVDSGDASLMPPLTLNRSATTIQITMSLSISSPASRRSS